MKDVVYALVFAFGGILKSKTMKFASITGLVVTLLWIVIGYLLWPHIVAFSSSLLVLIPFSMIRSNGAWMLSIFVWFELILITFALIFAFFGGFVSAKVSKTKYNTFAIGILITAALFWTIVWFYKGGAIHQELIRFLTWLPFETIDKGLSFIIGIYLIYTAIITTMIFVASGLNYFFIKEIAQEMYPQDESIKRHELKVLRFTLKDALIFLVASIVAIPLLFVPILNFIVQIALWMWLMKDTFVYDNLSLLGSDTDKEALKEHKAAFWSISAFSALFNLIPVLNLYGPFFGELAMFHYLKDQQHNQRL